VEMGVCRRSESSSMRLSVSVTPVALLFRQARLGRYSVMC
jgi:hypothetical protein